MTFVFLALLVGLIAGGTASVLPVRGTGDLSPAAQENATDPDIVVPVPVCQQNLFTCAADRACIPILQVCDGNSDCADGSDETDCHKLPMTVLAEQMVAVMVKYPGCIEASQPCSAHVAAVGIATGPFAVPDAKPSTDTVCQAYGRAATCLIWEACQYTEEDRDAMRRITSQMVLQESGCALPNTGRPRCVSFCTETMMGNFQSCKGCGVFATCSGGVLYDYRPCPTGLVWDDRLKRCEYQSSTCPEV